MPHIDIGMTGDENVLVVYRIGDVPFLGCLDEMVEEYAEAASRPGAAMTVSAHPAVIAALEPGPAAGARHALEDRLGRPLMLVTAPGPPGAAAEIVVG